MLAFPDRDPTPGRIDALVAEKIGTSALDAPTARTILQSGARSYDCYSIRLDGFHAGSRDLIALIVTRSGEAGLDFGALVDAFRLTRRELETLQHLVRGKSTKSIAASMDISPNTVKVFIKMIMSKMNVESRAAIVACALDYSGIS